MNFKSTILTLSLVIAPMLAHAWGDMGHQVVGEIADRNLTPEAKKAVLNILGPEALANAAIWPDQMRDDTKFDIFKNYHFAEVPTGKSYETMLPEEHAEKDAKILVDKYPAILQSKASRSVKLLALRYLIHVVGDLHQPLHVGNGKDSGGNSCSVKWLNPESTRYENLHSVWDTKIPNEIVSDYKPLYPNVKYFSHVHFTNELLKKYATLIDEQRAKIEAAGVLIWIKESYDLRQSVVYLDGGNNYADNERPYCKRNAANDVIPVIDVEYLKSAKAVVELRLIQGGLRLAALLNHTFKNSSTKGEEEAQIFEKLMVKNPVSTAQP